MRDRCGDFVQQEKVTPMRIWKLTPIDRSDERWKHWNPEPIFVRAETEKDARCLAASETEDEGPPPQWAAPIPINPWGPYQKLEEAIPSKCEDVTAGPAAVLNRRLVR